MPLDTVRNVVEVDEVLIALGLDTADYNAVERLVNAVSRFFENYTNNMFKKRRITQTFDASTNRLIDFGAPVIQVYSVTIDGSAVPASDYKVLKARGQIYREAGWMTFSFLTGIQGVQNVVVDADLGYDPVPNDLKEAAINMIRYWRAKGGAGAASGIYQSERIGEYSYTLADPSRTAGQVAGVTIDAPGEVLSVLNDYVRYGV